MIDIDSLSRPGGQAGNLYPLTAAPAKEYR